MADGILHSIQIVLGAFLVEAGTKSDDAVAGEAAPETAAKEEWVAPATPATDDEAPTELVPAFTAVPPEPPPAAAGAETKAPDCVDPAIDADIAAKNAAAEFTRIAVYDLETSNVDARWGAVVTAGLVQEVRKLEEQAKREAR